MIRTIEGSGGMASMSATEEIEGERLLQPADVLASPDPADIKQRLRQYLEQHGDSEEKLAELVGALQALVATSQTQDRPGVRLKSVVELRQKYESTIPPRSRKRSPFPGFLLEYLRETARLLSEKLGESVKSAAVAKDRESRIAAETAKTETAVALRREEDKLLPDIREKNLALMADRAAEPRYSEAHWQTIQRFEQKIFKKSTDLKPEERAEQAEYERGVKEMELLLAAAVEDSQVFGAGSRITHASKYDDYFNHADWVVEVKDGPTFLVDLTYGQQGLGEKLHYNQQHPLRVLDYPPHPGLKNRAGIPIVLGMLQGDAEEAVDGFLRHRAREQVLKSRDEPMPSAAGRKPSYAVLEKWFDLISAQLLHQKFSIERHMPAREKTEERARHESALRRYEEAIFYFEKLKKERGSTVQSASPRSSWERKLLAPADTIAEYQQGGDLVGRPLPALEIPSVPEAA